MPLLVGVVTVARYPQTVRDASGTDTAAVRLEVLPGLRRVSGATAR